MIKIQLIFNEMLIIAIHDLNNNVQSKIVIRSLLINIH